MYNSVYFVGIGGIGMSAIARYFMHEGKAVGGYDRNNSPLTKELEKEGAEIHYSDDASLIGERFRNPLDTLVVYTPAIPLNNSELAFFRRKDYHIIKRSEILGQLSEGKYVMAVAGTHGKTTTSTLVAWLNKAIGHDGNAFLGGISVNFGSNLALGTDNRLAVEADEFDRSFLRLHPDVAVVTSADADHLDIYGTHENVKKAFAQFISQIKPGGTLIIKEGVDVAIENSGIKVYRYALDKESDFYAKNLSLGADGHYTFDLVFPDRTVEGCRLGVMGLINVENAVAAAASVWAAGEFDPEALREGLSEFKGVKRRFECYVNTPNGVYIDDYAHHPAELKASITTIKDIFKGRRVTAIFQPHLFTRTRDFYKEFAEVLSLADEVYLLPIYPAREEPIAGVSSKMIAENISSARVKSLQKERLLEELAKESTDVVISLGAGDIDKLCPAIAEIVENKCKEQQQEQQ